ncbi:MAG: VWA domain-containing protein, partial [Verrucomicrobiales bacterium]
DEKEIYVISGEEKYRWEKLGSFYEYKQVGKRQQAPWQEASQQTIMKAKSAVTKQELIGGTDWEEALEMAIEMDPKPQVLYFMTDGASGDNSERIARKIAAKARRDGIVVNCVALMEPKAAEAMMILAERTNGQFTMVEKGGKVVPYEMKK